MSKTKARNTIFTDARIMKAINVGLPTALFAPVIVMLVTMGFSHDVQRTVLEILAPLDVAVIASIMLSTFALNTRG